jgi:hypothetical protein
VCAPDDRSSAASAMMFNFCSPVLMMDSPVDGAGNRKTLVLIAC